MDDIVHYEQFLSERPWLAEGGFCWTAVEPVTKPLGEAEVASRFGLEVQRLDPGQLSGDPYEDSETFGWIVKVGAVDHRIIVFEDNGIQGTRPEVLRWLSDGARAWSVYWNVNRNGRFCYAVYGSVVTELELDSPERRWGKDPHALDLELEVLPPNGDDDEFVDWRAPGMALVERCSGVRLTTDWLDQAAVYGIKREYPPDPRPPLDGIGYDEPDLDARMRLAPRGLQVAILSDVLCDLAERFDLASEPVIQESLRRLPGLFDEYDNDLMREFAALGQELFTAWEAERAEEPDSSGPAWCRLQAGNAFHAAIGAGSPFGEPMNVLRGAHQALADDWPALRSAIRARLTQSV